MGVYISRRDRQTDRQTERNKNYFPVTVTLLQHKVRGKPLNTSFKVGLLYLAKVQYLHYKGWADESLKRNHILYARAWSDWPTAYGLKRTAIVMKSSYDRVIVPLMLESRCLNASVSDLIMTHDWIKLSSVRERRPKWSNLYSTVWTNLGDTLNPICW